MKMKFFVLLCQFLWFACNQDSVQQPKVLYKPKTPEVEEVATPLATLKFQGSVTHMHVIDQRTCHNKNSCLLQGFILVGESSGKITFLTPLGNFIFQIPPPDICQKKPVMQITVTFYRKRIGKYDSLLFISFQRCGIYAIQLDSVAMRTSTSWTPVYKETGKQTVHELQVVSTRRANGCMGHAIVVLLDDMTLWSGLISMEDSRKDGDMNSCYTDESRFNKVDEGIVSFKTSRSSLYGLKATGEVLHALISHSGVVFDVSMRCDGRWRHEKQLLTGTFDLARRKTWFSAIMEDGTLQNVRVGRTCEVVTKIKILDADFTQNVQPLKLSATNGYSVLLSNKFIGMYNQTRANAGYDFPPVFLQKVDDLVKNKIPFSFFLWLQHAVGNRLFSIQKSNLHALLHHASNNKGIFLVSFANFVCMYRPNFFEPEEVHRSKKVLQVLGGLLKSVALVIAAALGIRWSKLASTKGVAGQARPSQEFDRLQQLSEDFRSNYGASSQVKTLVKRRTRPGDEFKVAMLPQADMNSNQREALLKQEKIDLAPLDF
eukprot:jgi/Picsp_1/2245/NSC_05709-R1_---NA---